jgi:hypothetical protein
MLSSAVAALLGLLVVVVFCPDHPFASQLGFTPAPFQHSLDDFAAIDRRT